MSPARIAFAVALVSCGGSPLSSGDPCDSPADIRSTEAAAALADCVTLAGLSISGAATIELDALRRVENIDGNLAVGPTSALTALTGFGNLRAVSGDIIISSNFEITGLFFDRLETVGGTLRITGNSSLLGISLPTLASVGTDVVISGNSSLESLLAPALARVDGELVIRDSPKLDLTELPASLKVRGPRHIDPPKRPDPSPDPQSPTSDESRTLPE